ncbi:TetR/AcrR family transcriptional regulator [Hyalangium rubrum]|uniref:TetR/AcrR family transcriptional regulator n=1 Tax=Hyalangium rubrum TaxID=3103134 RepID=A0ABU5HIX5_9BACT|nr:TetR/AcrR family transcriptional regulator [Hyalangium sp. s54d21]MDY7233220.1 TetR/AcrR family transcriptional regulator [Hyalangium sp. s54d21]
MAGRKGQVQKRGVERRRAIIDAAIRLFSQYGFRGTGFAAIAEQAGVTPSTVVHHFATKEILLQAVIEENDARVVARLAELGKNQTGVLRALEAMVHDARMSVEDPTVASLYIVIETENLSQDSEVRAFFLRRSRMIRKHLAELLREGIRTGEVRAGVDADAKAREIHAFVEGAHLQWLLDPEEIDLVALYRSYVDSLIPQLAAEWPGRKKP